MGLSPDHEDQVSNYVRSARIKREEQLRELEGVFHDFRDTRLVETTYTGDEVRALLSDLSSLMRSSVQTELHTTTNMVVLLLRQLFELAEKQYVSLQFDPATLEDKYLLDEIAKAEEAKFGKGAKIGASVRQLTSLRVDAASAIAQGQVQQDMRSMRERVQHLQLLYSSSEKEKTSLSEEVARLQAELDAREASASEREQKRAADIAALTAKLAALEEDLHKQSVESKPATPTAAPDEAKAQYLANLRQELGKTKAELDAAVHDNTVRLNESRQFQQLRKLLEQKNDTIKQLRDQLQRFQGDDDAPAAVDSD